VPQSGGGTASSFQFETDEEVEPTFAGKIFCLSSVLDQRKWVSDTGATDHITPHKSCLTKIRHVADNSCINIPNGHKSPANCLGDIKVRDDLDLLSDFCVPQFKFNLLSVSKLTKENNCVVFFSDKLYVIQDCRKSHQRISKENQGLYYLDNNAGNALSNFLKFE